MSHEHRRGAALRVAVILSTALARHGGLETCAREFARGLSARGHQVSLIAGAAQQSCAGSDYDCIHVPMPQLSQWRALQMLRPAWFATALQALLFFSAMRLHASVQRALAASDVSMTFLEPETVLFSSFLKSQGVPNVSYFAGGMSRRWFRHDRSAVRVAISRVLADVVARTHGIACDGVVTPGVPAQWLSAPAPLVPTLATRLIYVGRLEANKGVELLAALSGELQQTFPQLKIQLVGGGPLVASLSRHAALHVHGNLHHAQVADALRASDVFVFPSHYESFGIAPLEAQAVGIPTVTSDLPALREATGNAALYLPPHDRTAWVESLRDLLPDALRRTALARAGRAHAATMTWERAAESLERFLWLAKTSPTRRPGDALTPT